jgi:peptidoglycan/LPS O-acetylase OafA/YrhL
MMNKSKRLIELDALRGFAALGVVGYHYTTWYDQLYKHSPEVLIYFPKGKYGVELFFIISGFVIFMTLQKIKVDSDFLVGRFSRLFPAYWTAILLTFTVVAIAGFSDLAVKPYEALINLTMLQGFFNVPHVDQVYWTLEIELSFYTIMFTLYKLKLLSNIERITVGWLLLLIMNVVFRHLFSFQVDPRVETALLLNNANLFIIGLMFYKIYTERASVIRYGIIALSLLIFKLEYSGAGPKNFHSWSEVLIVVFFIILFQLVLNKKMKFVRLDLFLFLGEISYSLYLIHQNIGYVIIRSLYGFNVNPNISILIAIAVSIILASIITFLVEKPMMRLIKAKIFLFAQ